MNLFALHPSIVRLRRGHLTWLAGSVALVLLGCTTSGGGPAASPLAAAPNVAGQATLLRLGYFPNITHATAIVGVESGIFERDLGPGVTLETATFNAGSSAAEALLSGAIDAAYIGPNPAINAYAKSNGAVRIVAGATSGGAFLVVRPGVASAEGLRGRRVATPQLGNTQDVALRSWLLGKGLKTDPQGGGDVSVIPQDNAQTLQAFVSGGIDGAWVPEPWATQLIQQGHGTVLVDERDLWPSGLYVTTHLLVRTAYLAAHPDVIKGLLAGDLEASDLIASDPTRAQALVSSGIKKITGTAVSDTVVAAAWKNLTFTVDPVAASLKTSAENAVKLGLLKPVDLTGIYDLSILNGILQAAGRSGVNGL